MKIMISLKTYSSLPLAAAEKEEEEFSVKARYNAEREREKIAGREGRGQGRTAIYLLQVQPCNRATAAATGNWRRKDRVVAVDDRGKLCGRCDAPKWKVEFGLPIQPVISPSPLPV